MSKLAHSNQETMDEIERRELIESGNEDLIVLGTPRLQKHVTKSVIDVAWEATEQLEGTLRRLIDAAPPKSGAQAALKDAMIAVRENVLDALHELRMAKDERDELPDEVQWPTPTLSGKPWE